MFKINNFGWIQKFYALVILLSYGLDSNIYCMDDSQTKVWEDAVLFYQKFVPGMNVYPKVFIDVGCLKYVADQGIEEFLKQYAKDTKLKKFPEQKKYADVIKSVDVWCQKLAVVYVDNRVFKEIISDNRAHRLSFIKKYCDENNIDSLSILKDYLVDEKWKDNFDKISIDRTQQDSLLLNMYGYKYHCDFSKYFQNKNLIDKIRTIIIRTQSIPKEEFLSLPDVSGSDMRFLLDHIKQLVGKEYAAAELDLAVSCLIKFFDQRMDIFLKSNKPELFESVFKICDTVKKWMSPIIACPEYSDTAYKVIALFVKHGLLDNMSLNTFKNIDIRACTERYTMSKGIKDVTCEMIVASRLAAENYEKEILDYQQKKQQMLEQEYMHCIPIMCEEYAKTHERYQRNFVAGLLEKNNIKKYLGSYLHRWQHNVVQIQDLRKQKQKKSAYLLEKNSKLVLEDYFNRYRCWSGIQQAALKQLQDKQKMFDNENAQLVLEADELSGQKQEMYDQVSLPVQQKIEQCALQYKGCNGLQQQASRLLLTSCFKRYVLWGHDQIDMRAEKKRIAKQENQRRAMDVLAQRLEQKKIFKDWLTWVLLRTHRPQKKTEDVVCQANGYDIGSTVDAIVQVVEQAVQADNSNRGTDASTDPLEQDGSDAWWRAGGFSNVHRYNPYLPLVVAFVDQSGTFHYTRQFGHQKS